MPAFFKVIYKIGNKRIGAISTLEYSANKYNWTYFGGGKKKKKKKKLWLHHEVFLRLDFIQP